MFSFDGEHYMVHTADNTIKVYESSTGEMVVERAIEMADIPEISAKGRSEMQVLKDEEEPDPVLVASDKFLYALAPNRTQIKVVAVESLEHVHTIRARKPRRDYHEKRILHRGAIRMPIMTTNSTGMTITVEFVYGSSYRT